MKKKIMVVDDQESILLTIKMLLDKSDYKSFFVSSGKMCLEQLNKVKPDLILLDIMMPGMSGWEVCSRIKSNPDTEGIPIIFLTARSDGISQNMALKGADGYIEKPFDAFNLLNSIQKYLGDDK